jgi:hypothetical protein
MKRNAEVGLFTLPLKLKRGVAPFTPILSDSCLPLGREYHAILGCVKVFATAALASLNRARRGLKIRNPCCSQGADRYIEIRHEVKCAPNKFQIRML